MKLNRILAVLALACMMVFGMGAVCDASPISGTPQIESGHHHGHGGWRGHGGCCGGW